MIALFPSRAVALSIGGFSIHWYGVMYVLAFLLAAVMLPRLQKLRGLKYTRDQWLDILSYGIVGVLVGGRLGFVLFYEPQYFLVHPLQIFAVWQGGMSSHGGFIGVGAALLLLARWKKLDLLALLDIIVIPAAIGLAFGRFGNFINQELYGTVTALPWAIAIPGVEGLRHPLQIYELIADLGIALLCFLSLRWESFRRVKGRTFALFLMLYCVIRFLLEYVRDQQYALLQIGSFFLTRGQLLTIPVFLFAIVLLYMLKPRTR